jgi:hypothetical protein
LMIVLRANSMNVGSICCVFPVTAQPLNRQQPRLLSPA